MRRSKAFTLTEILMTIMLQAGFILVLCMSFYLFLDFYTRTQQVLTARNHAQRVIQFMDDKIRHAGLGLWQCDGSLAIRDRLNSIEQLNLESKYDGLRGYKLPVSLQREEEYSINKKPALKTSEFYKGDIVLLLYAQRDSESIFLTKDAVTIDGTGYIPYPSDLTSGLSNFVLYKDLTGATSNEGNIESYALSEAVGVPMHLARYDTTNGLPVKTGVKVDIPAASEFMYMKCIQMFVHDPEDDNGRQFAFRELKSNSENTKKTTWGDVYNQEIGILEIYMTLDTDTNIFTLYVLASGGEDPSTSNPRPEAWPNKANPRPDGKDDDDEISDEEAEAAWQASDYCHHTVYVARKSWKLNNIPKGFTWN